MFFTSKEKKALIIDDDKMLHQSILYRLKLKGIRCIHAITGFSGIDKANTDKPDIILLDWILPDLNGPDVLKHLKKNKVTRNIPVLMLTGRNTIGDIESAFNKGADAYLTKPVSLSKLGDKVIEMLGIEKNDEDKKG